MFQDFREKKKKFQKGKKGRWIRLNNRDDLDLITDILRFHRKRKINLIDSIERSSYPLNIYIYI